MLADLKMPKLDGLALLESCSNANPDRVHHHHRTGHRRLGGPSDAEGAYDYIEKPLNAEKLNRLKALIPKALDKFEVQQTNRELTSRLAGLTHYGELTGQSEAMREVYQIIDAVAPSTANVLILGESGTGKELVARALHSKSERSKGPFFALNCAALPKEILENELFGHEKGAFTGSTNEKPGAFEMAIGGTFFLDEVAEMSPDIQVKLLRALESRMVRRLGGKKEIAGRHPHRRGDQQGFAAGASPTGDLREDLYYRLAVVEIFFRRCASGPRTSISSPTSFSPGSRNRTARRSATSTMPPGMDPLVPLAGQCPRAQERGRARGDHGARRTRSP